jgi:hypothetical protein
MKKIISLAAAALFTLGAAQAMAATANGSVELKATLNSYAALSITSSSLDFGAQATPGDAITAQGTAYTAKVRQQHGQNGTLTITGADLVGTGGNTELIPAGKIQLTASVDKTGVAASPFALSSTPATAVTLDKSGEYAGNLSFALTLSTGEFWALPSDVYTGTQSLTLSAP